MHGFPKVTLEDVNAAIKGESYTVLPDGKTTVCQLEMNSYFSVMGTSAPVSKENFDQAKGEKYAKEKACDQVWMLLGYDMSKFLSLVRDAGVPTGQLLLLEKDGALRPVATYLGTKVVHATPMNREDYTRLRGWAVPADENPADEGFLIQYADGGAKNVPGFDGYISWSPKDVFERSYYQGISVEDGKSLQPKPPQKKETFLDRLRAEHAELAGRLEKLREFFRNGGVNSLHLTDQMLLDEQRDLMSKLEKLLAQRILRAEDTGKIAP